MGATRDADVRQVNLQTFLDHLTGAPKTIFKLQILPIPARGLLREIRRVLQPGGLVILETPNPGNLMVGACNFYLDPTHNRPIPSGGLEFLVEKEGFTQIDVIPLHPNHEAAPAASQTSAVEKALLELVYGAQDYAVIGRK